MNASRRTDLSLSPPAVAAFLDQVAARCTFPPAGSPVDCAYSGGADSTALLVLAARHGLVVTAHHVDHGLRPSSLVEAEQAGHLASRIGVEFRSYRETVDAGANLEARARDVRKRVLPTNAMTGHTADDQAETVLMRLLRGSGIDGLSAMTPGPTHPILALRRFETERVCQALALPYIVDPSNESPTIWRNRVRGELLPLAGEVFQRDVVPILTRTADVLRDDADLLDELASALDPTDAHAIAAAPLPLARRALRRWLSVGGYPPDAAAIERVLAVARGHQVACEISPGIRVQRTHQRLRLEPT